jgi:hypothetical protein
LSSGKYPSNDGTGAALDGGRWNPRGVEVVYAAATASLAALEVLVHFSVLPRDFVLTEIHIPAAAVIESIFEEQNARRLAGSFTLAGRARHWP